MTLKLVLAGLTRIALYGFMVWAIWAAFASPWGWISAILYLYIFIPSNEYRLTFYVQALIELMLAIGGIIGAFVEWGVLSGILTLAIYSIVVTYDYLRE